MKKIFLIAASAMMVLASCTKVVINYPEDAQPQEIAMFAVNKSATKAPVADENFPADYEMKVAAYLASGDLTENGHGDYFDGTQFRPVNQNKTGDPLFLWIGGKYWPVSTSTINFLAVAMQPSEESPYTGNVKTVEFGETEGEATKKFTKQAVVTFENNQTTETNTETNTKANYNQFDLMFAAGQGLHQEGEDYKKVEMTFKHALSWINFTVATNVKNTSANDHTYKMTVNSIRLSGASYGGTMTLALGKETKEDEQVDIKIEDANETSDYTCTWTNQSSGVEDVYVPGAPDTNEDGSVTVSKATAVDGLAVNGATAKPFGNGLLVVPVDYNNMADGNRPTITVNYTMNQGSGDYTFERTIEIPKINWEYNKKYTYALTITLNEIKVDPKVEKWDDTDENDTENDTTDDVNWGAEVPLG